jgi:hypothetical protein
MVTWLTLLWMNKPGSPSSVSSSQSLPSGSLTLYPVTQGATNRLVEARANGDPSYNPANAISVYYAQGRNEIATGNFLIPITQTILSRATVQLSAQSVAQYLGSIANNQTAIGLLARSPLTISNSVQYQVFNLRPYSSQVASAVTLVGFIYVIILRFASVSVPSRRLTEFLLASSSLCLDPVHAKSLHRI